MDVQTREDTAMVSNLITVEDDDLEKAMEKADIEIMKTARDNFQYCCQELQDKIESEEEKKASKGKKQEGDSKK